MKQNLGTGPLNTVKEIKLHPAGDSFKGKDTL